MHLSRILLYLKCNATLKFRLQLLDNSQENVLRVENWFLSESPGGFELANSNLPNSFKIPENTNSFLLDSNKIN